MVSTQRISHCPVFWSKHAPLISPCRQRRRSLQLLCRHAEQAMQKPQVGPAKPNSRMGRMGHMRVRVEGTVVISCLRQNARHACVGPPKLQLRGVSTDVTFITLTIIIYHTYIAWAGTHTLLSLLCCTFLTAAALSSHSSLPIEVWRA